MDSSPAAKRARSDPEEGESDETGGRPLPSIDHELADELADRTLYSVGLGKSPKCFLCVYTDEKLAEGSMFLDATRGPLEEVNAAGAAFYQPFVSADAFPALAPLR